MSGPPPDLPSTADWLDAIAALPEIGDDLVLAEQLVCRGAAIGAELRRGRLDRIRKTSVSDIVTVADTAAESDIAAALAVLRPDDGMLGEEGAARVSASGRTWIIDPIDGTYNFASGLAHWCSAIALRGNDELRGNDDSVLGAIRQESVGETWLGRVGPDGRGRAWLNGRPLAPLPDLPLDQVCLATYLHPTRVADPDVLQPWLAACGEPATLRMLGSGSCDLAGVAAGRLGAFLQHSTPDWDWYPGTALVRAVGGHTRVVHHRGLRWHLAGGAATVRRLAELLTSG